MICSNTRKCRPYSSPTIHQHTAQIIIPVTMSSSFSSSAAAAEAFNCAQSPLPLIAGNSEIHYVPSSPLLIVWPFRFQLPSVVVYLPLHHIQPANNFIMMATLLEGCAGGASQLGRNTGSTSSFTLNVAVISGGGGGIHSVSSVSLWYTHPQMNAMILIRSMSIPFGASNFLLLLLLILSSSPGGS